MMNKLAIIAVCGLAVSAVALGTAISMGWHDGVHVSTDWFEDLGDCRTGGATATSRTLDWNGGDEVDVGVPVNLHYKPGQGTQVVMTGDPGLLAHVKIEDGDIKFDCGVHHSRNNRIDITLPGNRTFREINLGGVGTIDLQDINQPELEIGMGGAGEVNASGKTDSFTVSLAGKGNVHAKDLIAQKVEVNIAGKGDVETSPKDSIDITIAGHGNVRLYSEPAHVETTILGHGEVEHMAAKG